MIEALLGQSLAAFLILAVGIFGGAAWMMGQALALSWRPPWQLVPYTLLLAAACRFLSFALFEDALLLFLAYIVDAAVLGLLALAAYRATRAAKMVQQYPWLFERSGPFGWRRKQG